MVTTSPSTPGIGFDDLTGRYRSLASGRFVPQSTVDAALNETLARAAQDVKAVTERLRAGSVNVEQWRVVMADSVKTTQLASSALANGGWAQMTQSDYGRIGQACRTQYEYLNRFAAQIADGTQLLDGTVARRAAMYPDAARTTYEATRRAEMRLRGYDEERNVRHADDSCPGCLEAEAQGWQPIGVISLPGQRDCLTNCRCVLEQRRSQEAA